MVITSDNLKTNLGLSLKFEAKSLKVIDYSKKEGRSWYYSEKAVELLIEYKARFFFLLLSTNDTERYSMCRTTSRLYFVVLIVMEMVYTIFVTSFMSAELTNCGSIAMIKASEALPGPDPDGQLREIKTWLKSKGVRDFEPVSIYCDQLTKVMNGYPRCRKQF